MTHSARPLASRLFRGAAAASLLVSAAVAQNPSELLISVDWQGPLMGVQTAGGPPITEADLLLQPAPFFHPDPPRVVRAATFLARYSQCVGHLPGISCGIEIDALSQGVDARLRDTLAYEFRLLFSVDEHAVGAPVGGAPPNVTSEAAANDAAGDIFLRRFLGPGPFGPGPGFNVGLADGDGASQQGSALYPGLGVAEPSLPDPTVPELGDNVDGLDLARAGAPAGPLFFSLEGGLTDPREPNVVVFDSAGAQPDPAGNLLTGADVLVVDTLGNVQRYAAGDDLGLDPFGADDLDALIVFENGAPGFQAAFGPYDWLPGAAGGARDMLLFSVRRGSAVIGQLDSLLGIPITEGDVLVPPIGGGMLGSTPGIFIAAETLGLDVQRGLALDTGDDLNALDATDSTEEPFKDCQPNGFEDAVDISSGSSPDDDGNGIPDECEDPGDSFCDCDEGTEAPCGNTGATGAGCRNNTGVGGKLEGTGTSSVATDSLVLGATQLTPQTFAVVFMGDATTSVVPPPNSNGRLCVAAGTQGVRRVAIRATGTFGAFDYGPGIIGDTAGLPLPATLAVGTTWAFQAWYRDNGGPCSGASNLTNGWLTTFTP